METRIAKRRASAESWSIPMATLLSFMAGGFVATFRHFSHDHHGYTSAVLVEHFVPYLIVSVTVCALLFALAATILNRLIRQP
jgi:hypothetical protein